MNVENESGSGAVSAQEDTAKPNVAMMTRNIGHLLRLARLRLANLMDKQLLKQLGITNVQATLLFLISTGESASLKTLAQSSGIEMARTSRLLTLLEERGMVTRVRSGSDRRVTELQLTDAIQSLLADEQVLAYKYHGTRFDCGSKLGYLKATVEFALRHPEVAADFEEYLRTRSPVLEG